MVAVGYNLSVRVAVISRPRCRSFPEGSGRESLWVGRRSGLALWKPKMRETAIGRSFIDNVTFSRSAMAIAATISLREIASALCQNCNGWISVKRIDRSEILYAKAAALSAPTRYVLHILAALPVLMFVGGLYALALICDSKTSSGSIVIIDILLSCLLINLSLFLLVICYLLFQDGLQTCHAEGQHLYFLRPQYYLWPFGFKCGIPI